VNIVNNTVAYIEIFWPITEALTLLSFFAFCFFFHCAAKHQVNEPKPKELAL